VRRIVFSDESGTAAPREARRKDMRTNPLIETSMMRLREEEIRRAADRRRLRGVSTRTSHRGRRLATAVAVVAPVVIVIATAAPRLRF
jgi:hypothetical protein